MSCVNKACTACDDAAGADSTVDVISESFAKFGAGVDRWRAAVMTPPWRKTSEVISPVNPKKITCLIIIQNKLALAATLTCSN